MAATVSRRRQQLARLERQVIDVRKKLQAEEEELDILQQRIRAVPAAGKHACKVAGKALRKCVEAKQRGEPEDRSCSDAGKALRTCRKVKQ